MHRVSADKLMDDLRLVVSDAEELIKETAGATGDRTREVRTRIERSLADMKARLVEAGEVAGARAAEAARTVKSKVEQHPWATMGTLPVVGLVAGILMSRK